MKIKLFGTTQDGYGTSSSMNTAATTMAIGAQSSDGQDSATGEFHSFLFFNTVGIPSGAIVLKARLTVELVSTVGEEAGDAIVPYFYMCDGCIGSSLTTADYGDVVSGGSLVGTSTPSVGTKYIVITDSGDLEEVNKEGYTNFEIDVYWTGSIDSGTECWYATQDHATVAYRPTLEVWYRLPRPKIY